MRTGSELSSVGTAESSPARSAGFAGLWGIGNEAQDYVLGHFQPSLRDWSGGTSELSMVLGHSPSSLREFCCVIVSNRRYAIRTTPADSYGTDTGWELYTQHCVLGYYSASLRDWSRYALIVDLFSASAIQIGGSKKLIWTRRLTLTFGRSHTLQAVRTDFAMNPTFGPRTMGIPSTTCRMGVLPTY